MVQLGSTLYIVSTFDRVILFLSGFHIVSYPPPLIPGRGGEGFQSIWEGFQKEEKGKGRKKEKGTGKEIKGREKGKEKQEREGKGKAKKKKRKSKKGKRKGRN